MIFSFVRQSENGIPELHAFPSALAEKVEYAVQLLTPSQMHSASDTVISVRLAAENLSIPYRVYYDKQQLLNCANSSGSVALIALCLGTRHYDGYLRELCLRRLLLVEESWIAPFVIQLLGEYVIEVVQPIHERFLDGVEKKYQDFFCENVKYCEYLVCRAVSYWNEYYRGRFPKHKDYPAVKALAALQSAAMSGRSKG
ncbi:hypothetical protein [Janthinobacterium sp. HH01]|uniref:hypothetical protein n=1 Tax=Janthinobacterium sp. HH01 TaxID=1198452 RepID=UPI001268C829|nr:hypothetical protein [Janthinobacterium sp. HH01]